MSDTFKYMDEVSGLLEFLIALDLITYRQADKVYANLWPY